MASGAMNPPKKCGKADVCSTLYMRAKLPLGKEYRRVEKRITHNNVWVAAFDAEPSACGRSRKKRTRAASIRRSCVATR